MKLIKLIDDTIGKIESGSHSVENIKKLLKDVSFLLKKDDSTNQLKLKVADQNLDIQELNTKLKTKESLLERSLSHCEFIEPLFEKYKKISIGRLELLNISNDTKKRLTEEIKKANYSDTVINLMDSIELKTAEVFSNKLNPTRFKRNGKNLINPNNYKSGR